MKRMFCSFQGGPGIRGARGDRGEPGPVVSAGFHTDDDDDDDDDFLHTLKRRSCNRQNRK